MINVGRILNFSLFLEYFLLLEIGVTHGINLEKSKFFCKLIELNDLYNDLHD